MRKNKLKISVIYITSMLFLNALGLNISAAASSEAEELFTEHMKPETKAFIVRKIAAIPTAERSTVVSDILGAIPAELTDYRLQAEIRAHFLAFYNRKDRWPAIIKNTLDLDSKLKK